MFWTTKIQKNVLILIGILSLSYVMVFLLSPQNITDYTIADTEYWRETNNRLLLKTAYEYNNKEDIQSFPETIGEWKGSDFEYDDYVYKSLNADIILSRGYTRLEDTIYIDFINSKTGESFHKQKICVEGSGWTVDNESIVEFKIAKPPNPFTKLYANRLDIGKEDEKQVMIYWFTFKKFGAKDAVTMIRISAPVNDNGTVAKTFDIVKDFVENQLFDAMYKVADKEMITMSEYIIREYGNKGILFVAMIISIPLGIIYTGIRKKD